MSLDSKLLWLFGAMAVVLTIASLAVAPALLLLDLQGFEGQNALLLFYLVLVVQISDVLQYVFGKLFGKSKVAPRVSPSKTVAGLVGGGLSATLIGGCMFWMTPFSFEQSLLMSLVIVAMGFLWRNTLPRKRLNNHDLRMGHVLAVAQCFLILGGVITGTRLIVGLELNDHGALRGGATFQRLATATSGQKFPTELLDRRRGALGVFGVLRRVTDIHVGNPISFHRFLYPFVQKCRFKEESHLRNSSVLWYTIVLPIRNMCSVPSGPS